MQDELCNKIMTFDKNIRFVGIVNKFGEAVSGGFKEGVEPLLDGIGEQELYVQSLSNIRLLRNFSNRLGKIAYNITSYDKVSLMTFPLNNEILCVSVSCHGDINKIKDHVVSLIKNRKL